MKSMTQLKLFSPTHFKFKFDIALSLIVLYYLVLLIFIGEKEVRDYLMEGTNIFSSLIGVVILVNAKIVDFFSFLENLKKDLRYDLWIKYKDNKLYKFIKKSFYGLIVFNTICLLVYLYLIFITDDIIDKILYFCISLVTIIVPGIVIYSSHLKIK